MLDALPDDCLVRFHACSPPLADAPALTAALGRLFDQFIREGRCSAHGAAMACDGALLVLAWAGGPLSGCSGDRIARLLGTWAARGHDLLTAPPLVAEADGRWRTLDRAGLRALAAAGPCRLADTRVATLGAWRQAGVVPAERSWAASFLHRAPDNHGVSRHG